MNLIYIGHVAKNGKDGGMARNRAFLRFFSSKNAQIYSLYDHNIFKRFNKLIVFFFKIFWKKNKKIFIHLGTFSIIFSGPLIKSNLGLFLLRQFLFFLSQKNTLFIEINDLPMEQAKDLGLFQEAHFEKLQKIIFNPEFKINYVFASHEMEKYALKKYNISNSRSQVIINGAPKMLPDEKYVNFLKKYDDFSLKYIYVGSLSKGRGIESLINLFEKSNSYLFLVGEEGEWINEKNQKRNNIIYLGSFNEQHAMQITSQCDYGIMHYNSDLFYYNLCYPTKNSFYISAGINVLSTRLVETQNIISKYNIFLFEDFEQWENILEEPSKYFGNINLISDSIKEDFYWDTLLYGLKI